MTAIDADLVDVLTSTAASCRLLTEQDEGPYHRDLDVVRRDITEDRVGVPLRLGLRFLSAAGAPLAATVEVWHADKDGRYSGFPAESASPGETFLRGTQRTDDRGLCAFETIYPGWYPGRTVHIHLIAHVERDVAVTTQLFFPEEINDHVLGQPAYKARGSRDTTNATDDIFANSGEDTMLALSPRRAGYTGVLCAAVADRP